MVKLAENLSESGNDIKKILIGSSISIIITLITLLIFAILLTYTNISENTIPTVTIILSIASILIGSTISMSKIKKNGIIKGGAVGLIYIMIIYLLSSIIEKNFALNTQSIIMIIGSILSGIIGGVIGVNRK